LAGGGADGGVGVRSGGEECGQQESG
jgi:hypothetical protein